MKEMLHRYLRARQLDRCFLINAFIVSVIVSKMMWSPEDIERQRNANMMKCFGGVANNSRELQGYGGLDRYRVVIKNQLQFFLVFYYLRVGQSFLQAAHVFLTCKECSGLVILGLCSDGTIEKYACIASTFNLQNMYKLLNEAQTFAISMKMSTLMSTFSLDILVRLHLTGSGIFNVHILAVLDYERHTAEVILDTAGWTLDVLCPSLRDTIIGNWIAGEKETKGRVSGVETQFQNVGKR